jgi:tRNA U34 2-thiouridine synthase MnmA/TrmU
MIGIDISIASLFIIFHSYSGLSSIIWYYTIGQRRGIGLSHGPWYVVAKDAQKNIVYISNTN